MIIEKKVCESHRDVFHWKEYKEKPITLKFTVKDFENGSMAYVEAVSRNGKIILNGNSLWNLGKMTKNKLLQKIESYIGYDQVRKDFY